MLLLSPNLLNVPIQILGVRESDAIVCRAGHELALSFADLAPSASLFHAERRIQLYRAIPYG